MVTGPYGRQWISPRASAAFSRMVLDADFYCIHGDLKNAIRLYRAEAAHNHIARRRLSIAQKQIHKTLWNEGGTKKSLISIGFIDWYSDMEKDGKSILNLFSGAGLSVMQVAPEDADILLAGSYGSQLAKSPKLSDDKLVIFFSGENLCPSYDIHDFSITTRSRDYCGKNIRYPQWLGELYLEDGRVYSRNSCDYIDTVKHNRDLLITSIYNNATPEREEMVFHLNNAFGSENIHVFGSQRSGEVNKFNILSRSVINLCFENSLGEGYVTEKLLHARMMGCKALYWGDSSYLKDFQSTNILNVRDFDSFEPVIDWCRIQFAESATLQEPIATLDEALFRHMPTYDCIYHKILDWSKIVLSWRN